MESTLASLVCSILMFTAVASGKNPASRDPNFIRLTTVSQIVLAGGKREINVHYEAQREAEVQWRGMLSRTPSEDVTNVFSNGQGKATILAEDDLSYVYIRIGFMGTRCFQIGLHSLTSNRSVTLNTRGMSVTPGLNLAYSRGQNVQVRITGDTNIADGWRRQTMRVNTGVVVDPVGKGMTDMMDFTKVDSKFPKPLKMTFNTSVPINGYLEVVTEGVHKASDGVLVDQIYEEVLLSVHEDSYTSGPFPDDFLTVTPSADGSNCTSSVYCFMGCYAYGNHLTGARLYKVADDGSRVEVKSGNNTYVEVLKVNWYFIILWNYIDATTSFAGTYVCQFDDATTSKKGEASMQLLDGRSR